MILVLLLQFENLLYVAWLNNMSYKLDDNYSSLYG